MSNVPVFTPTYDEFENFSAYISKIESLDAHKIGLAKIIPPKEWTARKRGYKQKEIDETLVENPIKQEVHGKDGFYSVYNIQQKSIKLNYFEKLCQTSRYATPTNIATDYSKLEKKYWQNLTSISPIYGADVSGSFYDKTQRVWNITNLGTILDDLEIEYGTKIEGVNTAYLYFGMWKATFAWHTEDMDLYSINYLHFGAPKQWYVIPPSYGKHFENFAASRFPSLARRCPAFLRHKMTLISPSILTKQSIPYYKMIQNENEFIITFPYAYHAGFNYGFNCAESTNFALERWIEYGKHSIQCVCRHDMVKIGMDRFVLKYQPNLYNDWCQGINRTVHPEANQSRHLSNITIVRSSPTKIRLITNPNSVKNFSTNKLVQLIYQEQISEERYTNIYRNLSNFDKLNQLSIVKYSQPLVRAALSRTLIEFNQTNSTNHSQKLLYLTSKLVRNLSSIPNLILFHGLEQSNTYYENLLDGLWNFQNFHPLIEQYFNQWLTNRINSCAICYLFKSIQKFNTTNCLFSFRQLLKFEQFKQISHDLIQCSDCYVSVHQDCYENLCLALNVNINDNEQNWICQRCYLKRQSSIESFNDHCSACLFRGGLLLQPTSSSSFIHAICSIYQSYRSTIVTNTSCHYCWLFCPLNYRQISTHIYASCDFPNCSNHFHLTCGLINGCTFDIDLDDSIINAHCHLHSKHYQSSLNTLNHLSTTIDNLDYETIDCLDNFIAEQQQQQQQHENEEDEEIIEENKRVPIGTRVRLNDRKEEKIGRVIGNEISFHYAVDFDDGCYSHDMLAEDILDFNPSIEPLTLTKGSNIRIKWTDGLIYSCKYVGRKRVLLYHIQFDNETRQIRRDEFVYDIETLSPPLTPCQLEREHNYSRRQSLTTRTKRKKQQQIKRKRKRVVSSSDEAKVATM